MFFGTVVDEELIKWISYSPKALTWKVYEKLNSMASDQQNKEFLKVIQKYSPLKKINKWGDDSIKNLNSWIDQYSNYINHCFIRKEFLDNDPIDLFPEWLKKHYGVIFHDEKYSYTKISKNLKKYLNESNRCIVFVLIDGFAIQLVQLLLDSISFAKDIPEIEYLFSPVPTTTEISKKAIISGEYPKTCQNKPLKKLVKDTYSLNENEILFIDSWNDIKAIKLDTKFVLVRDNRIDNLLHNTNSYSQILDTATDLFKDISNNIENIITDIKVATTNDPILIISSDHGFTYLANSINNIKSNKRFYRSQENYKDCLNNFTILPKDKFLLNTSFSVCKNRNSMSSDANTVNANWIISHGGILPEEVVIPFIKWDGGSNVELKPFIEDLILEPIQDGIRVQFKILNNNQVKVSIKSLNLEVWQLTN